MAKISWKQVGYAVAVAVIVLVILMLIGVLPWPMYPMYDDDMHASDDDVSYAIPNVDNKINYDHMEGIQAASLEPEIIEEHREHAKDSLRWNGSSKDAVFDHDYSPTGWHGLRRPKNNVKIDATARQVPSAFEHQMPKGEDICF
jgi:hypothetical protein